MANLDHVKIVLRGGDAITDWLADHPGKTLNLENAELEGADLSHRWLSGANLRGAQLQSADLSRSILSGADLRDAHLSLAWLDHTNLSGACLESANLVGARIEFAETDGLDLRNANLNEAIFKAVRFYDATLANCTCIGTVFNLVIFSRADFLAATFASTSLIRSSLLGALNLESISHIAASSLDVETLFHCGAHLPTTFLRGCGVPDTLIDYLPSLLSAGIDFYSAFISYSGRDEAFAKRLHARLREEHLRVWFAPEDVRGGRKLHEQIFDAIRVHDKLLLVLSPDSMKSEWVTTEIRRARKRERDEGTQVLFPIRLVDFSTLRDWECFDADSGKDLAVEIREYFIPDFSNWKNHDAFEAEFAKLLKSLKHPREMPKTP